MLHWSFVDRRSLRAEKSRFCRDKCENNAKHSSLRAKTPISFDLRKFTIFETHLIFRHKINMIWKPSVLRTIFDEIYDYIRRFIDRINMSEEQSRYRAKNVQKLRQNETAAVEVCFVQFCKTKIEIFPKFGLANVK